MSKFESSAEELMSLEREACRRQQMRDYDWMIQRHSDSAIMLPPGAKALASMDVLRRARVRAESGEVKPGGSGFSWEPTDAVVSPDEQMGFVYGVTKQEGPSGEIGTGKYLTVWSRHGGEWKVVAEIRNDD